MLFSQNGTFHKQEFPSLEPPFLFSSWWCFAPHPSPVLPPFSRSCYELPAYENLDIRPIIGEFLALSFLRIASKKGTLQNQLPARCQIFSRKWATSCFTLHVSWGVLCSMLWRVSDMWPFPPRGPKCWVWTKTYATATIWIRIQFRKLVFYSAFLVWGHPMSPHQAHSEPPGPAWVEEGRWRIMGPLCGRAGSRVNFLDSDGN